MVVTRSAGKPQLMHRGAPVKKYVLQILGQIVSPFTEYELTYADIDADVPGGVLQAEPWNRNFVLCLAIHPGRSQGR